MKKIVIFLIMNRFFIWVEILCSVVFKIDFVLELFGEFVGFFFYRFWFSRFVGKFKICIFNKSF